MHGVLKNFQKVKQILLKEKEEKGKPDAIFLQETHIGNAKFEKLKSIWKDGNQDKDAYQSEGHLAARKVVAGVIILTNEADGAVVSDVQTDPNGRLIALNFTKNGSTYRLINIYGPNSADQRPALFQQMESFLSKEHPNILGGDFNCVESPKDRQAGIGNQAYKAASKHTDYLTNIAKSRRLVDVYRRLYPQEACFTYTTTQASNGATVKARLDRFYISNILINEKTTIKTSPPISDHHTVELMIDIPTRIPSKKRGPSYWKLNSELLNHELADQIVHKAYEKHGSRSTTDWLWWDDFKEECKEEFSKLSKLNAKNKRLEKKAIEFEIASLERWHNWKNSHTLGIFVSRELQMAPLEIRGSFEPFSAILSFFSPCMR